MTITATTDQDAHRRRTVLWVVTLATVGLIFDGRGRPLELPEDRGECRALMTDWISAMQLYAPSGVSKEM